MNSKGEHTDLSIYCKNEHLLKEIAILKETGKITNELGEMVMMIAENFGHKSNFAGYTYLDDMIGDATYIVLKYLKNFDTAKSVNPFAYITQIIYHSFIGNIKKQKKHSDIKDTLYKISEKVNYFEREYSLDLTTINYRELANQFGD